MFLTHQMNCPEVFPHLDTECDTWVHLSPCPIAPGVFSLEKNARYFDRQKYDIQFSYSAVVCLHVLITLFYAFCIYFFFVFYLFISFFYLSTIMAVFLFLICKRELNFLKVSSRMFTMCKRWRGRGEHRKVCSLYVTTTTSDPRKTFSF